MDNNTPTSNDTPSAPTDELKKASDAEAKSVLANTNIKIALKLDEESNIDYGPSKETPNGADSSPEGTKKSEKSGKDKVKGKKKMNIFLYWLLTILTLGLWSRFRPRKGGWKGSWFTTVIMLTMLCSGLIGERFYKPEINEMARQQLQIEADILPEVLPFESGQNATGSLKKDAEELEEKLAKSKTSEKSLLARVAKLSSELEAAKKAIIKPVQTEIIETEVEVEVEVMVEVTPVIEHSTFNESDLAVGCTSPYSAERSKDVFDQKFKGKWVNWNGVVEKTNNSSILMHLASNPDAKALVKFEKEGAGYYMLKGKEVSMTFKLEEQGTCDTPFVGAKGIEQVAPDTK